ncbi:MAG: hypothetical protein KF681_05635 [Bdellovibrionaceae bacterium]|nr:hypothetical protein [Pseudobdellovibrionaceae bacterium]
MRLLEKGEISFVFLWVLNPVVILFYQNCAPSQLSQANTTPTLRTPASVKAVTTASNSSAQDWSCKGRQQRPCAE